MARLKIIKVKQYNFNVSGRLNYFLDNVSQLPALNETQIKKLKVLSIATLSETQQVDANTLKGKRLISYFVDTFL